MDRPDTTPSGRQRHKVPARVQVPIELSPSAHRRLAKWCRGVATDLEVKAIPLGDVLETMIDQLLNDKHTADAVRRELAKTVRPRKR